jgi:hypothetical protein
MVEVNSNSQWTAGTSSEGGLGKGSVPAPPPEVKVRTFKSDLESMMQSGGGAPQYQSVRGPEAASKSGIVEPDDENKSPIGTAIAAVVGVLLLGGIAYFAYRIFTDNNTSKNVSPPPTPVTSPLGEIVPPLPPAAGVFVHHSFFKRPADRLLALTVPASTASNAYDLATFSQRVQDLIGPPSAASSFFEIVSKNGQGNDLLLPQILQATDLGMLDEDFVSKHFLDDATLFVWQDSSGTWPGLVIGLKSTENWLFIQNDVAKLESSPKLANLFVTDPGAPLQGGFKDIIEDGQHARMLTYSAPRSVIVYGLFHSYMVLSTSEDGLKQAIIRLVE